MSCFLAGPALLNLSMAADFESVQVEIRTVLAEFRRTREPERLARLIAQMDALIDELMEFGKRAMKKRSGVSPG
jgi:hypothetical protein